MAQTSPVTGGIHCGSLAAPEHLLGKDSPFDDPIYHLQPAEHRGQLLRRWTIPEKLRLTPDLKASICRLASVAGRTRSSCCVPPAPGEVPRRHDLFEVVIREGVSRVPANAQEDNHVFEMQPTEQAGRFSGRDIAYLISSTRLQQNPRRSQIVFARSMLNFRSRVILTS